MIAFVTLLLGVVFGVQTVELSAGPQVARVELYINGTRAAELGPPWRATIDLGDEIAPHELVAVALDDSGQRLGEARQWVNRATSAAEAGFVLERDDAGRPVAARLVWRCPESPDPTAISVSFDGRRLEVAESRRIPLPSLSTGTSHILLADLAFPGGITATAVASFGGRKTDDALQELTAVPIRISPGTRLPTVDQMVGWFEAGGQNPARRGRRGGSGRGRLRPGGFGPRGAPTSRLRGLLSLAVAAPPAPRAAPSKPLPLHGHGPAVDRRAGGPHARLSNLREYTPAKVSFLRLARTPS